MTAALGRVPFSVSQLTALVRDTLAVRPELEDVLVEGEISNLRNPGSGHLYFTLKDSGAALRCVCFRTSAARIPFHPESGMTVIARGRVDVYDQEGVYQLYVDSLEPAGVGAAALAVEQRRRRLYDAGLLDAGRKRPLPLLPRRVAVVTSSTGAAVRDVCIVAHRRAPSVGVVVVPTPVQGEGAEASLVRALRQAQELRDVDVVLLVRGGGSFEDLLAFQGEDLARAIAASRVPVVTGIGHETDTTIADLVADRRGATPSHAAEIAVPDINAMRDELLGRVERLKTAVRGEVGEKRRRLGAAERRLALASPERRLASLRQHLDGRVGALRAALLSGVGARRRRLEQTVAGLRLASPEQRLPRQREALQRRAGVLAAAMARLVAARRARVDTAQGRLEALSPRRVLERGFSITMTSDGRLLRSARQVEPGNLLRTMLERGEVTSEVVGVADAER